VSEVLYPIGFSAALVSLMLWQYNAGKKSEGFFRVAFSIAILAYILGLFSDAANFEEKTIHIVRDFLIIGFASFLMNGSKKNPFFALVSFCLSIAAGFFIFTNFQPTKNLYKVVAEGPETSFLVEMYPGSSLETLNEFADDNGFLVQESVFTPQDGAYTDIDDYLIITAPSNYNGDQVKEDLLNLKGVEYVEVNEKIAVPELIAATPYKSKREYGINDPNINMQWGFDKMKVDEVYKVLNKVKPQKKALIAILDTGVDAKHEDLKKQYRSIDKSSDADGNRHGTHCAGIAAAVTNNKIGIASFSPNNAFVEVSSVKVLAAFGGGTQAGIIKGIIKAADAGADVISMSLGGISNDSRQKAYKEAVEYANKKGAIVVVAAGNSNANAKLYAPANTPGVITVAAMDQGLKRAKFSNFITDIDMGICAPGVDIYSTIPDNKYAAFSGTSMATPQVAGLLGIMKSINPSLTTKEAFNIISETGLKLNEFKTTGAFIQPAEALKKVID